MDVVDAVHTLMRLDTAQDNEYQAQKAKLLALYETDLADLTLLAAAKRERNRIEFRRLQSRKDEIEEEGSIHRGDSTLALAAHRRHTALLSTLVLERKRDVALLETAFEVSLR